MFELIIKIGLTQEEYLIYIYIIRELNLIIIFVSAKILIDFGFKDYDDYNIVLSLFRKLNFICIKIRDLKCFCNFFFVSF
jgi:hypothetical protein